MIKLVVRLCSKVRFLSQTSLMEVEMIHLKKFKLKASLRTFLKYNIMFKNKNNF